MNPIEEYCVRYLQSQITASTNAIAEFKDSIEEIKEGGSIEYCAEFYSDKQLNAETVCIIDESPFFAIKRALADENDLQNVKYNQIKVFAILKKNRHKVELPRDYWIKDFLFFIRDL